MTTSDERREVAARLRELASENQGTLGSMRKMQEVLTQAKMITGTMHLPSVAHVLERYADLIDPQERTCHMEHVDQPVGFTLKCDVCGNELGVYETEVERYAYCPNCGARIVDGDAE